MSHRITLERNTLRFAAAHFTTFGGECEPLHGHNYAVLVEIEGDLTVTPGCWTSRRPSESWDICKEPITGFFLPLDNPSLTVKQPRCRV
jgi:6-pyruvoyltetrahydropterin/6-carboxytetrahydropterin synthase